MRGLRVLELGCGPGDNLAHLVGLGATGIGIDVTPAQVQRARSRWHDLRPRLSFEVADAASWLRGSEPGLDCVISVFGALSFCSPEPLLRAIYARLGPGGRVAFSVRLPGRLVRGRQVIYTKLPDGAVQSMVSHVHDLSQWRSMLHRTGFAPHRAQVVTDDGEDGPTRSTFIAVGHG